MKFFLFIFLITISLSALAQPVPNPIVKKDTAQAPAQPASFSNVQPAKASDLYTLTMPFEQWVQLLQIIDQSNAPHLQVSALANYIQQNAKKVNNKPAARTSPK